ncbi:MAG: hypothetical protein Kow0077_30210 [Anaerolineae bacterium]
MLNEPTPADHPASESLDEEASAPEPLAGKTEVEISSGRRPPIPPAQIIQLGAGFGLVMMLIAAVWGTGQPDKTLGDLLAPRDLWQVIPGMIVGALGGALAFTLGKRFVSVRTIVKLLEETIDLSKLTFTHVLIISMLAAIPEEMLFRGAMQGHLGLLITSLIFGGLHAITRTYFLYATAAGLLLGILRPMTGSLWLAIGAHFALDVVAFMFLLQREQHFID